MLHLKATQPEELEGLVIDTVLTADQIEEELFQVDQATDGWHDRDTDDAGEASNA